MKRRLVEEFPDGSTWEFYGSTEGQFTACRSEEWLERPGTLGRARPGRTMFTDEDGHLWCVVPPHARFSYFGDPEKTAAAWRETDAGPAFTVGDLGHVDDDGYVFLDGRREDLIISGGVNVYPAEVERVLGEVSGVEDIAVFGAEDEQWGQRVCAAVVGPADEEALRAHAHAQPGAGQAAQGVPPPRRSPAHAHRKGPPARPARPGRAELMGFSKAELASFNGVEVPDLLPEDLRLLFVGINPGLWTAAVQAHFARPGNRFYPALLRAGIITEPVAPSTGMSDREREHLQARGLGITNLVPRATAGAAELTPAELREGRERLRELVRTRTAAGRGGGRDHRLPARVRGAEGPAGPAGRALRGVGALGGAEPQRAERARDRGVPGRGLCRARAGRRSALSSLWQEVAEACHHCHCWLHLNGRIVTAMTTLLVLLAVIAGVAIIAALRDVLFHDGSHSFRQPPTSHYPDRFDPRFIA